MTLTGWILEKFHTWTYHPADKKESQVLPDTITTDEFLTHVSIYWLTQTMASSMRIYYETLQILRNSSAPLDVYVEAPTAVGYFPAEMSRVR